MTITYSRDVSSVKFLGLAKLLFRWRGSIYKLLYRELLIFLLLFYLLTFIYEFVLGKQGKKRFENVVIYCSKQFHEAIPMTFVLGFYIALVVRRWWEIYLELPWLDKASIKIGWLIKGNTERARLVRRTLVRYLNLMPVLALHQISSAIKRRFPTLTHVVDAGLMSVAELEAFELQKATYAHPRWWLPAAWFNLLLRTAVEENLIDEGSAKNVNDDMLEIRQKCANLWSYDWVSIPLVYTQVVTWVVYAYFLASIVARITVGDLIAQNTLNRYFPFFPVLQFLFFMGWLKVAEQILNPLGHDHDDFEVNWLVDRNLQTSLLIVDGIRSCPPIEKDVFWDDPQPELPYTVAAAESHKEAYKGSADQTPITEKEMQWDVSPHQINMVKEEPDALDLRESRVSLFPPPQEQPTTIFRRMMSHAQSPPMQKRDSVLRMEQRLSRLSSFAQRSPINTNAPIVFRRETHESTSVALRDVVERESFDSYDAALTIRGTRFSTYNESNETVSNENTGLVAKDTGPAKS